MTEQNFEIFAENTTTAISNMNEMIKAVQHEAVVEGGNKIDILENDFKKYKNSVEIALSNQNLLNIEYDKATKKVLALENKINILDFDEDGKFQELKNICKKRNLFLCGNDESNPEYILFYRTLMSNIYNYISNSLHVSRTGKIKLEDFDGAKSLARNYRPDKFKMNQKFKSLFKAYNKGTLTLEKSKAMDELLVRMNGSFDMDKLFGGRCI